MIVNISELKSRLSHYLREVRRGHSVLVTDRDRVVARIEPAGDREASSGDDARWLDELERQGTIRRAEATLGVTWLERRPNLTADVVAALLRERENGR